ncbi:hypothetical protein CTA1_12716 [Colletotrichum tanaceti]|uniref:Transmembrane protein n=1 Tax=Colletotrichum tanaceti TaxID=1306861 RepID=A0A4U6X6S1_9PEZI|nr:hypothetical protein CTA1_12716 [Colletotrichum tanaceti]
MLLPYTSTAYSMPSLSPNTTAPAGPPQPPVGVNEILTLVFGLVASFTAFIALMPVVQTFRRKWGHPSARGRQRYPDNEHEMPMATHPQRPRSNSAPPVIHSDTSPTITVGSRTAMSAHRTRDIHVVDVETV